jgi:hypothetical protein
MAEPLRFGPPEPGLSVLTRNLYVGASVEKVLASPTLAELPVRVAQGFATVQATRFPERARAIAEEVAAIQPHVIGVQEAALYRVQSPGDFFQSPSAPATAVAYDYLEILLEALRERGLRYRAVGVVEGGDLEVPSATGDDIRLTDRDALLVREDVPVWNVKTGTYQAKLTVPFGAFTAAVTRGWVAADAWVGQRILHFVTTHLEPAPIPELAPIQLAQAAELLLSLHKNLWPTVLMGDFNSRADGTSTATYGLLLRAGFEDSWVESAVNTAGYTCCQDEDLRNEGSALSERIDFIFTRKSPLSGHFPFRYSEAQLVGASAEDKTPSGLWPSDHAGVAVQFSKSR